MKKNLRRVLVLVLVFFLIFDVFSLFKSSTTAATPSDYLPLNHFAVKSQFNTTWSSSGTLANPGGTNQYIYFGSYPQSSNGSGGYLTEPIRWRILENSNDKLLVMSDRILNYRTHTPRTGGITIYWSQTSSREWLVGSFFNTAFTAAEQNALTAETVNFQHYYGSWTTNNITNQKIYLLSGTDVRNSSYGPYQQIKTTAYGFSAAGGASASRTLTETAYASSQNSGAAVNSWHTTTVSPSTGANRSDIVNSTGQITTAAQDAKAGMVPATKINLANIRFASSAPYNVSNAAYGAVYGGNPTMHLRFYNSTVVNDAVEYVADANGTALYVNNATVGTSSNPTNVVIQGSVGSTIWYYSKPVSTNGSTSITATELIASGIPITNISDCVIWTERKSPSDNFIYASTPIVIDAIMTREPTPAVTFDAATMGLSLSDITRAYYWIGNDSSATAPTAPTGWTAFTNTTETITVIKDNVIHVIKMGDGITTTDSTIQQITVGQHTTPSVAKVDPASLTGTGSITGVDSSMEYSSDNGTNWTTVSGTTIDNLAPGTYLVRVKASGTDLASVPASVTIVAFSGTPETVSATFDAATMGLSLSDITRTYYWIGNDSSATAPTAPTGWTAFTNTTETIAVIKDNVIHVIRMGDVPNSSDSTIQFIAVMQHNAPTGVEVEHPTVINGTGRITGVDSSMEYSNDGGLNWNNISGTTINGLDHGTYLVRYQAAGHYLAGPAIQMTINAFIPGIYYISFHPNDGSGTMMLQTLHLGISQQLNANQFTRSGYTFIGWNSQLNGSGNSFHNEELVTDLTTIANSTVMLYAQWKSNDSGSSSSTPRFNIQFDSQGGSMIPAQVILRNATVSEPKIPTKDGYDFIGWYTDKNCTVLYDFSNRINKSFTLYAGWVATNSFSRDENEKWLELPYVNGYGDGTFAPDNNLTRAEAVTLLYNLLGQNLGTESLDRFSDMSSQHWAANAMAWAIGRGYIIGDSNADTVRPDHTITRCELAALLYRINTEYNFTDKISSIGSQIFSDMTDHWAAEEVYFLTKYAVITGYSDGTFKPGNPIKRSESVAMISRLIGRSEAFTPGKIFNDVAETHWAYSYIMNAANGLKE